MDRTEERILGYALEGIHRQLTTLIKTVGRDSEHFKELHDLYLKVYDEYEKEHDKFVML